MGSPSIPTSVKPKMSYALAALLVYTVGVKCRGLNKKEYYAPEHMFSLSENMLNKLMGSNEPTPSNAKAVTGSGSGGKNSSSSASVSSAGVVVKGSGNGLWMVDMIKHTRGHLVRVYPKGTRVSSTNYEPGRFWAVGAQLVALNWQTFGGFSSLFRRLKTGRLT